MLAFSLVSLFLVNVVFGFHVHQNNRQWALHSMDAIEDLTYRELQGECKRLGLKATGKKEVLLGRLSEIETELKNRETTVGFDCNVASLVESKFDSEEVTPLSQKTNESSLGNPESELPSSHLEESMSAIFGDAEDEDGLLGSLDDEVGGAISPLLDQVFSDMSSWSNSQEDRVRIVEQARSTLLSTPQKLFHTVLREYSSWLSESTLEERSRDRRVFEAALFACRRGGLGDKAESVLRDMSDVGFTPSESDFHVALQAYVANGDATPGLRLLKAKALFGVIPSETSADKPAAPYLAMMQFLMHARNRDDGNLAALHVIDNMRQNRASRETRLVDPQVTIAGDTVDSVELEAVRMAINAATRLGDWQRALNELEEARRLLLLGVEPLRDEQWDISTLYVSVMSALLVARESDRVLDVFELMEADGVDPNGTGYGLAISAASRLGSRNHETLREAIRLLVEAHELREDLAPYPVDSRAYLAVIDACSKANFSPGASQALNLAVDAEVGDARMFECAIRASAKAERPEQARQHLNAMRAAKIKPTLECYNAVISAYEGSRRLREALPLLEEMRIQGIETNVVTYNVAMRACAAKSDWARAYALMDEMEAQGVEPTVESYCSLISACIRDKNAKRAVSFLEEMVSLGISPDLECYNAALRVCVDRDPGRAVEVLGLMVDANMRGDKTTVWAVCRVKDAHDEQLAEVASRRVKRETEEIGSTNIDLEGEDGRLEEVGDDDDDDDWGLRYSQTASNEMVEPGHHEAKRKRMSSVQLDAALTLFHHFGPGGPGSAPKFDRGGSFYGSQRRHFVSTNRIRKNGGTDEYSGKRFGRGGGRGGPVGGGIGGHGRRREDNRSTKIWPHYGGNSHESNSVGGGQNGGASPSNEIMPPDDSDFLTELQNLMK